MKYDEWVRTVLTWTISHEVQWVHTQVEEIPPLFEHSHQFFAQREGPFARQVHDRERYECLGPRRLHHPQFDDHSEQQDRECTNLNL